MNRIVSKLENKIGKVTIKFTITVNQKHFKGSLNNQRITTKILSSMQQMCKIIIKKEAL